MRKVYFFIIVFLVATKGSIAQSYTWIVSANTDYTVATNWSPARTTPLNTDNLFFNPSSPIVVDHVANQTIGSITIGGISTVTLKTDIPGVLTISGSTALNYTLAGSLLAADNLTINLSNAAAFTISKGTFGIAPLTGGKIIINSALTLNGASAILDFDESGASTTITGSITYINGIFTCANAARIFRLLIFISTSIPSFSKTVAYIVASSTSFSKELLPTTSASHW